MADFTLTVKTDSSAELLDIVSKIAGAQTVAEGVAPKFPFPTVEDFHQASRDLEQVERDVTASGLKPALDQIVQGALLGAPVPTEVLEKAQAAGQAVIDDIAPARDGHGIKRDDRIHANAADPFKADGTWKRRKNVPDEQYEEIHLELVREARAAGLYTGPAVPELELEDRVEDTEQQTGGHIPASDPVPMHEVDSPTTYQMGEGQQIPDGVAAEPNPNAGLPVEVATPAPVPAAPAPGMSAESTPTMQQVVVKMFHAAGVNAMQEALKVMKLAHVGEATPQQLRDLDTVAEMVKSLNMPDADKPAKGPEHTREALVALGYVA